ncbi:luciferase [Actinoplanes sp. SE50]|uniref:TIGR03557 family F420-dependent LLM class oxidoreductase n=1 Tax=unclassified Actinoplanes TaxID=2626549 RepID=UPI00023EC25C|nr:MULTISPECIES: TIGR03557 family F420-dependent LLM class oxidoreductase [unclassified Actinoplanes]AEV83558.1 Alkanesulfonate monooxygenase [Actinoplanes sp. SE50/110]ATO82298.1 luciferase [Actinoplanes sp. SE50]SLL99705.1 LLM class F420-dependent oxidoreductase [Actinoplanes sp. SE50/110]
MRIGYFLSSEEYTPAQLIEQAELAQDAGFQGLWISDHYHPWNDAQGQSSFVWSVIGALSQVATVPITTAVTCPIQRIHPAIIAQAAATSAVMHEGRFILGVGTGEALNEHVTGMRWPMTSERLEMLEEAVAVMRELWTGEFVTHRGRHYEVDQARIYTRPAQPPKVYVSAFGPKAIDVAARIGDGYISVMPDGDLVTRFREAGGGDKPVQGGFKGCWAPTEEQGVEIAHRLWANAGVPGELSQVLPSPRHFEQASELVTPEMTRKSIVCGPDPAGHAAQLKAYEEAGFDEVYVANIGPNYRELIDMYRSEFL